MTENKPLSHPVNDLRRQAEEKAREIAAQKTENLNTLSSEEIRLLFYDLQIHQIELEMQNEDLHQTHEKSLLKTSTTLRPFTTSARSAFPIISY